MDEPERPWTEEQWERFMQEADVRAARFGELLETQINHPDQDIDIRREMGWGDEREEDSPFEREQEDIGAAMAEEIEEEPVESIEGYNLANAIAEKIHHALDSLMNQPADQVDEEVGEAWINMQIAAAKIPGGHGMGYEDDVLCGNIVNCRRALAATQRCGEALRYLRERKLLAAEQADVLLSEVELVGQSIGRHIAGLRARVWW